MKSDWGSRSVSVLVVLASLLFLYGFLADIIAHHGLTPLGGYSASLFLLLLAILLSVD